MLRSTGESLRFSVTFYHNKASGYFTTSTAKAVICHLGEVRDREKVTRGLKRADSPILRGYQLYHNFIRPHEGLNGDTPAERTGIRVEGTNKWLTLIQNASKQA